MYTSNRLLLAVLAAALAVGWDLPVAAADGCRALQEQRDLLARQAMQAEIDLLHGLRQRLCPSQEALATGGVGLLADPAGRPQLDLEAYIHCRQQAEVQLQRQRPVLYTNRRGFIYYTAAGASLAREADALQPPSDSPCNLSAP
jgi:hypothetical protein